MDYVCRLFLIALFSFAVTGNQFENSLTAVLQKWQNGDIRLLPSLKDVKIPFLHCEIDGILDTGEVIVTGLENFTINSLHAAASERSMGVEAEFYFPWIKFDADSYRLSYEVIPFWYNTDTGMMSASIKDLVFKVNMTLENDEKTFVKYLDVDYTVQDENIQIHLSGSDFVVNNEVNLKTRRNMRDKANVTETVQKTIIEKVNEYMFDKNLDQIIEAVHNLSESNNCDDSVCKLDRAKVSEHNSVDKIEVSTSESILSQHSTTEDSLVNYKPVNSYNLFDTDTGDSTTTMSSDEYNTVLKVDATTEFATDSTTSDSTIATEEIGMTSETNNELLTDISVDEFNVTVQEDDDNKLVNTDSSNNEVPT